MCWRPIGLAFSSGEGGFGGYRHHHLFHLSFIFNGFGANLFSRAISKKNLFLSLLLLAGILLTIPEFSANNQITLGILWGLGSSATYAVLSLLNRYLSSRYDGMVICFYEQLTVAGTLWPMLLFSQTVWTATDIGWVAVLGVLCTAFAFSLFVYGQRYQLAQTAGIISGLETVYGILFAMVLLQEFPTYQGTCWRHSDCIGGAVIGRCPVGKKKREKIVYSNRIFL